MDQTLKKMKKQGFFELIMRGNLNKREDPLVKGKEENQ
jgi:hypothetical protein